MTQQFTASEVRRTAAAIEGKQMLVSSMLRAYADLLEVREKAVPFGYVYRYWDGIRFDTGGREINGSKPTATIPLYTHTPTHSAPSDAERLAEALRVFDGSFLKELADLVSFPEDDRGCINRSFVMGRVVGLRRCWDKLSATRAHSAQAQPPAASATKRERKGHTEWRQGSEKDGGGTTNYVEPVWVWDEPEQTAARVPDAETLRLHLGELTPDEVCVAKAAYRLALAAQENHNG